MGVEVAEVVEFVAGLLVTGFVLNDVFASILIIAMTVAGEMTKQTPRQIVQIMRALAQQGVAQALDAQTGLVLHTLHGRFGGETCAHRIAHPLTPSLVIGEQAIGLDHLAPLACEIEFGGNQHLVHACA